jgi:23S rRNA (uridine2552-2'-O)-methyltransferase
MSRFVVKDTFFKKAKQDGYRARSAYKLKEIQEKFRIIRKGGVVLDLGCAPGSFLQVISEVVGPGGLVLGIDLLPLAPLPRQNVVAVTADIRSLDLELLFRTHGLSHVDAITCDIAPNLTGIKEVDNKNSEELYDAVLGIVRQRLKKGGNLLMKVFFSEVFGDITKELKKHFGRVSLHKPAASRSISSEIYCVCLGKK